MGCINSLSFMFDFALDLGNFPRVPDSAHYRIKQCLLLNEAFLSAFQKSGKKETVTVKVSWQHQELWQVTHSLLCVPVHLCCPAPDPCLSLLPSPSLPAHLPVWLPKT